MVRQAVLRRNRAGGPFGLDTNGSVQKNPRLSMREVIASSASSSMLTQSPVRFCQKTRFEASRAVFWSLSCYKELKRTKKPFTGRTLHGPLIQMQHISLRKQNFETAVT